MRELSSFYRQLRSNIRGFLLLATIQQLYKELEISLAAKDMFRAEVIKEMIVEVENEC